LYGCTLLGCDWGNDLNSDIEVFLQQLYYFEMKNSDVASCHGVKGRLAKNIKFWEKIGANNFVLETPQTLPSLF
jgi:hypothetical protein